MAVYIRSKVRCMRGTIGFLPLHPFGLEDDRCRPALTRRGTDEVAPDSFCSCLPINSNEVDIVLRKLFHSLVTTIFAAGSSLKTEEGGKFTG